MVNADRSLGIEGQVRRFTFSVVVRVGVVLGVLALLVVGTLLGVRSDHGPAVATQATPLDPVTERSIDQGTNADCRATVRTTNPRRVTRRIEVPCGVTPGNAFPVYLYRDGTISADEPTSRVQLWFVSYVVGAVLGLLLFLVVLTVGGIALRLVTWHEDR